MLSRLVIVKISHEKCTRNPFFFFFVPVQENERR